MIDDHCCRPRYLAQPGGLKLCHSRYCAEHPGERITRTGDPREIERQERMANILGRRGWETVSDGPSTAGRLQTWRTHKPGCPCEVCQYVDSHLDRDDDLGGSQ